MFFITDDKVNIGSKLSRAQKNELLSLLNKYVDRFSFSLQDLGKTNVARMHLRMESDQPITYRPYRLSYNERERVRNIIQELLEAGIIRDSESEYASPILLVKKKTGEDRMCIDYRALNKLTKKDKYPLPLIEDQLDRLKGNMYFTSLDLASGYYQVQMEEESIPKTAFVTPDGHYEFLRMPFGLANAPAVFQRMMNSILGALRHGQALAYMDDCLLPSKDFENGLIVLEHVLLIFRSANLTLRLDKCRFFQTSVEYLGLEVTIEGVRPGVSKINAVSNFKRPENVHEVRQFIGLASYFRKFVAGFALIAKPLTDLTKKNAIFAWTAEQEDAFVKLKLKLTSRPVLAFYNYKAVTEVHTDASKHGVGGILLQKQQNGKEMKPVAYFSRKTSPEEERYHSYELEALAVVYSLQRFRSYLLGLEFKVVTDCNALKATMSQKNLIPRIGRWWLTLQEFNFVVEYRPGKKMSHVDALSRNAMVDTAELTDSNILHLDVDDWLLTAQLSDVHINELRQILQRKPETDREKSIHANYILQNNRVFRKNDDVTKFVVPLMSRNYITRLHHDQLGHFSVDKTVAKIQEKFWFPQLRSYVKRYIGACIPCLYNKCPGGRKQGYLHPIPKTASPMDTLHVDHLGPFVKSRRGFSYLLVCVDGFTKYAFLQPVKDTKTSAVIRCLHSISSTFGMPRRIITDRGSAFTSKGFSEFCKKGGIKHTLNAVATPRANGQVERYNRTIISSLASLTGDSEESWDKHVPVVQRGLNITINKSTGKAPSVLMFGFIPRSAEEGPLMNSLPNEPQADLLKIRHEALAETEKQQEQAKVRFDKTRGKPHVFKGEDLVMVRRVIASNDGRSKKLLRKYAGPYRVTAVLPNDRYQIEDIEGAPVTQKPYRSIVALDKLKRFSPLGPDE